jgi:Putative peptidoglycan binding domain
MSITRRLGLSDATVAEATNKAALLVLGLLDKDVAECVRRCAVPATFDRATYDKMLRVGDGLPLEQLRLIAQIGPVPAEPDRFRMAEGMRREALGQWWDKPSRANTRLVPERLAELAGRLAERAGQQGRETEQLDLLILHNPEQAAKLFVRLFDEADGQHDLSACQVLLDVLDSESRRHLLGPQLTRLRRRCSTQLARRELWSTDYYRSAFYVSRPRAEDALLELLSDDGARMTELFADGGMGKTMQLRWFIARHCIPRRIPCARIDFDDVSAIAAARRPWLLLLEVAAQLDGQLDGQPFQELLAAQGHYRSLLRVSRRDQRTTAPRTVSEEDSEDIRIRFVAALAQVSVPVVVVLDTLEQLMHGSLDPAKVVVATFAKATQEIPRLRVVMAGRYSLAERAAEILPAQSGSLRLEPLTSEQQQHYLKDIRGIDDPDMVGEVARLSEGRPLTLSIYAEIVSRASGTLHAKEVASWTNPGIVAAIQRYVARVKDKRVRWLIRYGVIPRRLRFPFVQKVLWPHLSQGMTGRSSADDPELDSNITGVASVFATDLEGPDEAALKAIWDGLRAYASDYGWLSIPDDEPEALAFRADVVRSLRDLISDKEVFAEIQDRAASYFEELADEQPDEWLTWTREVIYHRLRQSAELGARAWEQAIDEARTLGKQDWCLELATSLLHEDDFVDWQGAARPPMTAQLLALVHVERARAATAEAVKSKAGRESPLWDEAQAGLIAAHGLADEEGAELPETSMTVIEAQVRLGRGDPAGSAALLRGLGHDLGPSTELAALENALGRALLGAHDAGGIDHLESSYRTALQVRNLPAAMDAINGLLDWYAEMPDPSAAFAVIRHAYDDGVVERNDPSFVISESSNLAAMGMATKTRQTIERINTDSLDPAARAAALLIEAWAHLRSEDHDEALRVSDRATPDLTGETWLTSDDAILPLVIKGVVCGDLMRMTECTGFLLSAAARAREFRDHDAAALYSAVAADYRLGYAGDLEGARQCLDEAERSPAEPGSEGLLRTHLVQAALASRLWGTDKASGLMKTAIQTLEQTGFRPTLLGLALTRGLAFKGIEQGVLVAQLEQTVRQVPALSRPSILEGLRYAPVLSVDPSTRDRLKTLLHDEVVADPAYDLFSQFERAPMQWAWAETMRVLGLSAEARSLLDTALEARDRDMYGWYRWLDAMERLGLGTPDEPAPDPEWRVPDRDELSAVCHILLAERRMNFDPPGVIEARLRTAAVCLAGHTGLDHWVGRRSQAQAALDSRKENRTGALRSAAEAASTYSRLGDASAFDRVTKDFALGGVIEVRDPDTVEVRFELSTPESARLTLSRADGTSQSWTRSTAQFGDVSDTGRSLARLREAVGPLTGGWRLWSEQVAEVILPPEIREELQLTSASPRDVCLRFDVRDLAAMPWELTQVGHGREVPLVRAPTTGVIYRTTSSSGGASHQVRALQRCLLAATGYSGLVDGIYGPVTQEAVGRFQGSAGLPASGVADRPTWTELRRRVLAARPARQSLHATLLQIGARREVGRQRGYASFGTDPATAYAAYDWDVDVWEYIDVAAMTSSPTPTDDPPDLVHVVAPIRLSGGSTILDLAGDATARSYSPDASTTSVLSVTGLSDLLTWLGGGAAIPIVLLDIPLPQSPLELVRSLALRNSFAYQLLRLGRVESVLCTGLAEPGAQVEILEHVVGGLAGGLDVTEVARHLQSRGGEDDFATAVAFGATALYLERPPFTYLPLG